VGRRADALLTSYLDGTKIEFNYSEIRARGTPLRTSGGRAPGHLPLKKALTAVERVLEHAPGRALRPIEVYDILMHVAVAVLSGGIRRSATICLFSADDDEMAAAKTGNWFETNPQRGKSNNSAVLVRGSAQEADFSGCSNIRRSSASRASTSWTMPSTAPIRAWRSASRRSSRWMPSHAQALAEYGGPDVPRARGESAGRCATSPRSTRRVRPRADVPVGVPRGGAARHAAGGVHRHSLPRRRTRLINDREALLGVSICGVLERPAVLLDPHARTRCARCLDVNAAIAEHIGVARPQRVTCVKPEGTASLVLGAASGIHPHHARRYFRRVQAARTDAVYQWFKLQSAPDRDLGVGSRDHRRDHLPGGSGRRCHPAQGCGRRAVPRVRALVQQHWVEAGRRHERYNPGLHHNVSNTVTVRDDEWDAVQQFIWENRAHFAGISLLRETGDKVYAQAPREGGDTEADMCQVECAALRAGGLGGDARRQDVTALADVVACAGGACELSV
jgi:ribonucleoside-triphosphate reductase (thioredoxin)